MTSGIPGKAGDTKREHLEYDMNELSQVLVSVAFCIVLPILSGCAARESASPATFVPERLPDALPFNEQIAALPEGSIQYFAESPFGPASIEAEGSYLSGMGHECRSARAASGDKSHRFVVCREKDGEWRFIPTIFESILR